MFKGQKYQPDTSFEFVNYEQSSSGVFREPKKPKLSIPNTMKFQLSSTPSKSSSPDPQFVATSKIQPAAQTHTFVAGKIRPTPKVSRKASYTVSTTDQKVKLVDLIKKHKVYSSKPKLDAWNKVVRNYNSFYNLEEKEGLTIQHARVKLKQIIAAAEEKNGEGLSKDEQLALDYNKERQQYRYEATKDVKIDKRYENKNPKYTKVYDLITKLQSQLEQARDSTKSDAFKTDLWLLHKRVLDLKTIEEQYQILEQVDYNKEGARVKVSKEMRDELYTKAKDIQSSLDLLLESLKADNAKDTDEVVDTELLGKKEA